MVQGVPDTQRLLGQVSALSTLDKDFRDRLAAAPQVVLGEFGIPVSAEIRVELVADPALVSAATAADPTLRLYVPEAIDLTEVELAMVAGAQQSCQSTWSTLCPLLTASSMSSSSTNSCS